MQNHLKLMVSYGKYLIFLFIFSLADCSLVHSQTNFWEPSNVPYGGAISSFALDSYGCIYAGTSEGVLRSNDAGLSWEFIGPSGLIGIGIGDIAVNALGDVFAGADSIVYRSINHGDSWQQLHLGTTWKSITSIAIDSNRYILVGNYFGGIFISTDNGNTWKSRGLNGVLSVATGPNNVVLAGANDGLYRSTNRGINWVKISPFYADVNSIVVDKDGVWFAGGVGGVYRSYDSGVTWTQTSLTDAYIISMSIGSEGSLFVVGSVRADHFEGILKTVDKGKHWTQLSGLPPTLAVIDIGNALISGTNRGIFRSTDSGAIWKQTGGLTIQIKGITASPTGLIFANTNEGLYLSRDFGNEWNYTGKFANCIVFDNNEEIYLGSYVVYKSLDSAQSWSFSNISENYTVQVISMAFDPEGNIYVSVNDRSSFPYVSGIYLSIDRGTTWSQIESNFTPTDLMFNYDGSFFALFNGIYRSINNGRSWFQLNVGLSTGIINELTFGTEGRIYIACDNGVFRSDNNGNTWIQILNKKILSIFISPTNEIYVGGNEGVFHSSDIGNTWLQVNSGLLNYKIISLTMDPTGFLYAVSESGNIFRSAVSQENKIHQKVVIFSLEQNYPNPFNSTTSINYSILYTSVVKLKVYDILGKGISTLINEKKLPGKYSVVFNSKNLPSGVYFYRLEAIPLLPVGIKAGRYSETKKIILLK